MELVLLSKSIEKFTWYPQMSKYNPIMLFDIYERNRKYSFSRGESIWVNIDGLNERAIYIGEARESFGVKVKLHGTGATVMTKAYSCYKLIEEAKRVTPNQQFSLLAKRLRQLQRMPSFQKSINYLDYLIERNEINFPTKLTFTTIVKKIEDCYYRTADAIYFELDIYMSNTSPLNSFELESELRKAIVRIKQCIKGCLSSRLQKQ
jgi:hypothetical protein